MVSILSVEVRRTRDPSESVADIFFRSAAQTVAVREEEVVEIPFKNGREALPKRYLVPA